jgi:hypothetical protein
MERWLALLVLSSIACAVLACGCMQSVKLPAVKVDFMHYNITGHHILKINSVEAVWINRSEAPTLYIEPPYPGIHLFAYFSQGRRTPITYVPLEREGDNITAYIGFRDPKSVPKSGEGLIVVVDAIGIRDNRFESLAIDSATLTWDLE